MVKKINEETPAANSEKLKALRCSAYGQNRKGLWQRHYIMRLGDEHIEKVEVIPSGSILLDAALGVGGYPRGRIVEIFGPESSGKTTLALHAIAEETQKTGRDRRFYRRRARF